MLVSVVIPCFNAERYIAATLRSVLAQSAVDLDVIVVDDGSTDASASLVAQHFPQVLLLQRGNAGVAAARNAGMAAARGDWIAFCDADDIWLPGKLAAQFDTLTANSPCRMSFTAWHVWASATPEPEQGLLDALQQQPESAAGAEGARWLYPELLLDCVVWTSTVLAHRSVFDEVGGFDPGLRVGEDYDLWLRASRVTRIAKVERPFALYRQHPASITRTAPTANYRRRVVETAIRRWGYAGPDGRTADRAAVRKLLAKSCSDYGAALLSAGDRAAARRNAREAIAQQLLHLPGWKLWVKSMLPTLP